jgi:hypothetical protein
MVPLGWVVIILPEPPFFLDRPGPTPHRPGSARLEVSATSGRVCQVWTSPTRSPGRHQGGLVKSGRARLEAQADLRAGRPGAGRTSGWAEPNNFRWSETGLVVIVPSGRVVTTRPESPFFPRRPGPTPHRPGSARVEVRATSGRVGQVGSSPARSSSRPQGGLAQGGSDARAGLAPLPNPPSARPGGPTHPQPGLACCLLYPAAVTQPRAKPARYFSKSCSGLDV